MTQSQKQMLQPFAAKGDLPFSLQAVTFFNPHSRLLPPVTVRLRPTVLLSASPGKVRSFALVWAFFTHDL